VLVWWWWNCLNSLRDNDSQGPLKSAAQRRVIGLLGNTSQEHDESATDLKPPNTIDGDKKKK